jgi:DNA-binding response OmpR family regulator
MEATGLPLKLSVVSDGEQAVRFFDEAAGGSDMPCPTLVILDINLPKKQGGDVLKHMRQSGTCASTFVIVVSTSDSERDREGMMNLGADGYFRKPSDFDEFMRLGDIVKALLAPAAP